MTGIDVDALVKEAARGQLGIDLSRAPVEALHELCRRVAARVEQDVRQQDEGVLWQRIGNALAECDYAEREPDYSSGSDWDCIAPADRRLVAKIFRAALGSGSDAN